MIGQSTQKVKKTLTHTKKKKRKSQKNANKVVYKKANKYKVRMQAIFAAELGGKIGKESRPLY